MVKAGRTKSLAQRRNNPVPSFHIPRPVVQQMSAEFYRPQAVSKQDDDLPTLAELVEKVGLGPTHARFILLGGGTWLADGSELLLICSVTHALTVEWNLSSMQRGSMVTIAFVGVLLGNLISGPISDRYGRRHPVLVSYAGIVVCSIASSFAGSFVSLGIWRFFFGLSMGVGNPAWNVLSVEVAPTKWRTMVQAMSYVLFTVGEVFSALLIMSDDPDMVSLDWRMLLRLASIPAFIFGIASLAFLHESPFFLAQAGHQQEASDVLSSMSRENCLPDIGPMHFKSAPAHVVATQGMGLQCGAIWRNRNLRVSLLIIMSLCFLLNFNFYGGLYAFPNILPYLHGGNADVVDLPHTSASAELLFGALWETPGIALGCLLCPLFPRKLMMKVYVMFTASSLILFAGTAGGSTKLLTILNHVGYYSCKCFGLFGFIVVYLYVSEVYPTAVRTIATGISLAAGRFGTVVAPLVYEKLTEITGTWCTFFYVGAMLSMLNLAMIDFLPYETFESNLKESFEDGENPRYGGVLESCAS